MTSVSDAYSSYAFGYNDAGWLTSQDNSGTPGMPNVVLTHGYNAFGERTSRSDNLGGSTAFTFDQAHRMSGATLTVGTNTAQVAWTYDNADRLTRITRNGAMPGMAGDVGTTFTLDNMDRVKRIAHSSYQGQMMGQPPLHAFDYTWNAASEITSYTGPEGTLNYSYDTTSQLTGVSGARSEGYSFDLNGNRTMAGYSTGTGNRLLSDGVYDYQQDNEGNLTVQTRISDGERTEFTWDHRNRLTKVLIKDSGGTTIREARFTYDVFDRLIGRWIDSDGAGPQAGVQTWHAYDGQNPYADFNSSGSLTNRYFYAAAIDELMGRMSASGVVDWYMPDLIGSTRQIVNKMGTSTLYTANYDSFGNIASQSGTGDRFKYAARELEAAIDQYHNRARWYDPRVGRFTSEDPIGFEADDANLFRYVGNSPLSRRDPLGLEEWVYTADLLGGMSTKGPPPTSKPLPPPPPVAVGAPPPPTLSQIHDIVAATDCAWFGGNVCHLWVQDMRDAIVAAGLDNTPDWTVTYAEWVFPPYKGWIEHAALEVTTNDGNPPFYIDNGFLGGEDGCFYDCQVPENWNETVNHGKPLVPGLEPVSSDYIGNAWQNIKNKWNWVFGN